MANIPRLVRACEAVLCAGLLRVPGRGHVEQNCAAFLGGLPATRASVRAVSKLHRWRRACVDEPRALRLGSGGLFRGFCRARG